MHSTEQPISGTLQRLADGFVFYKYITDMSNLTYLYTDLPYFFSKMRIVFTLYLWKDCRQYMPIYVTSVHSYLEILSNTLLQKRTSVSTTLHLKWSSTVFASSEKHVNKINLCPVAVLIPKLLPLPPREPSVTRLCVKCFFFPVSSRLDLFPTRRKRSAYQPSSYRNRRTTSPFIHARGSRWGVRRGRGGVLGDKLYPIIYLWSAAAYPMHSCTLNFSSI